MSKIAKRLLFVALILALGFGVERLTHLAMEPSPIDPNDGRYRVVVIGGSIAMGTAPKLEYHLRRTLKRDDIDVIDSAIRMANVQVATTLVDGALEKYKPKLILVMLGLNEDRPDNNDRTIPLVDAMKNENPADAALKFDDFLKSDKYTRAAVFIFQYIDVLRREPFREEFTKTINKHIEAKLAVTPTNEPTQRRLFTLNIWLEWLYADRSTKRNVTPAELAMAIRDKVDDIISRTRRWPAALDSKSYQEFVSAGSDDYERALRGWFWAAWTMRKNKADQDVVSVYSHEPDLVTGIVPGLRIVISNKTLYGLLDGAEPRAFYQNVLTADPRSFWGNPENRPAGKANAMREAIKIEQIPDEKRRMIDMFDTIRVGGARPVMLHYPGLRLKFLDELSSETGVPVIGDEHLLDDVIRVSGREVYYLDEDHGTGHLTDAGFEIFCKFLAEKISPLIQQLEPTEK